MRASGTDGANSCRAYGAPTPPKQQRLCWGPRRWGIAWDSSSCLAVTFSKEARRDGKQNELGRLLKVGEIWPAHSNLSELSSADLNFPCYYLCASEACVKAK